MPKFITKIFANDIKTGDFQIFSIAVNSCNTVSFALQCVMNHVHSYIAAHMFKQTLISNG